MTFFSEKISTFTAKISDDLFVIDLVFRIFPFFSQISVPLTRFNVVYDPFLTRTTTISEKNSFMTPFFTLFVLSRASDYTTSQNIGGTDAWAVPPPQSFFGTVPPVPPRSPPLSICMLQSIIIRMHSSIRVS